MVFTQTATGVTLVASGSVNLDHFILLGDGAYYPGVKPSDGYAKSGSPGQGEDGIWILDLSSVGPTVETGSVSFGSSSAYSTPTVGSGPSIGIRTFAESSNRTGGPYFFLGSMAPVSGELSTSTSTWSGATLSSLGLEVATYTVSWGTGVNADSWTVSAIPETSSALLSLMGVGALMVLRRRD